ncbi:MCE family protein [Gordonia pseudamarae]|jgi:phospholipid/cholesterol/gamma-HCH transport system substrate-binding protein|uniref:MCE family protein n=1 Tax=Gordonia pseudamarae TaxID=2831662 RepID=A0ABX6IG46_9ACTN|nr:MULTISPECIES: MCE family protein [Gordonia]MBD0021717.1 MCE family protein [Gordonia sp. (in: high G+C Gram-positive bacteria)]QHN25308.1 MCE family protein [Gordonia pseudamarae]QHN34240.1 MCE family protein [Gordonia pseudamarae]
MYKYRGGGLVRAGWVGLTLIVLMVMAGLNMANVTAWFSTVTYQADFEEAGGLAAGADVTVSGVRVGTVSRVELVDGLARVRFTVDTGTRLGRDTAVQIRTGSLLGQRVVTVEPKGAGTLNPSDVIPVSRTASPYSLNEAVDDLTTNATDIDTDQLNDSLQVLTDTMTAISPDLGPTLDALAEVSRGINARNGSLRELLSATGDITGLIGKRAEKVNTLILNADSLLGVLVQRRREISSLLVNVTAVSQELSGLVADNEKQLGPTLAQLNSVVAVLEKNRDNLDKALPLFQKVSTTQGEAVSGGPFYQAFVGNLIPGPLFQPFIDRAFGLQPEAKIPGLGGGIPLPRTPLDPAPSSTRTPTTKKEAG